MKSKYVKCSICKRKLLKSNGIKVCGYCINSVVNRAKKITSKMEWTCNKYKNQRRNYMLKRIDYMYNGYLLRGISAIMLG